jgi:hypothetical protein
MPFTKGKSGNPAGRPKGSQDKVTRQTRQLFMSIMEGQVDYIEDALDRIRENDDEKYIKALTGLLPYFMPKQQEIDVSMREAPKPPSWFDDIPTSGDTSWATE